MAKRPDRIELTDRFWSKIDKVPGGCWNWVGRRNPAGYGVFDQKVDGTCFTYRAHRLTYDALVGPLGDLHIDHLCRNRACCNPAHLEAVTNAENTRRGLAGWHNKVKARAITECASGHPYTPENTYIHPARGTRDCLTCRRAATARHRAKKMEALCG